MGTSFGYKVMTSVLRLTKHRNKMIADAARGEQRNTLPPKKYISRWRREDFEGRAIWICEPKNGATDRVYVHQHGGGFVYGLMALHYMSLSELSDHAEITVIMPDYPLPPDAHAREIIRWADRHFESCVDCYGLENVSLGGDSAGANLSLAILRTRAGKGDPNTETVILWSPWLDLTGPKDFTKADDYGVVITPFGLEPAVGGYLGDMDRKDPLISPFLADISNLPSVHIVTGAKDILYPPAKEFAEKADAAGKLASLTVEPDYGHYWMFYPVKDRHRTLKQIAEMLRPV